MSSTSERSKPEVVVLEEAKPESPMAESPRAESSPMLLSFRLFSVVAAVAALLLAAVPVSGAAADSNSEAASAGARWVGSQIKAGVPLELFGSPDWGVTLDAATALAANDAKDPLIATVWNEVVNHREEVVSKSGADIPGALAKTILLAHSTGKDPRAVGAGPGADLVARLIATMQSDGHFGTQFPGYDGVYRQGISMAALSAAGAKVDPKAIAWLLSQQCTNAGFEGAFMAFRADTSVPCADDPAAWSGADTNATALAVSGLALAAKDDLASKGSIDRALAWLAVQKQSDGGWSANSWSPSDPNSAAVVIQALIATNSLADARFASKATTPQAALAAFQIGASAPETDRGAFTFPGTGAGPNLLASVAAVPPLASKGLVFLAQETQPMPTTSASTTSSTVPPSSTTSAPSTIAPASPNGPAPSGNAPQSSVASSTATRGISFTG